MHANQPSPHPDVKVQNSAYFQYKSFENDTPIVKLNIKKAKSDQNLVGPEYAFVPIAWVLDETKIPESWKPQKISLLVNLVIHSL